MELSGRDNLAQSFELSAKCFKFRNILCSEFYFMNHGTESDLTGTKSPFQLPGGMNATILRLLRAEQYVKNENFLQRCSDSSNLDL